ncbi:hypothetical protein D9M70_373090 [compost metagenome]
MTAPPMDPIEASIAVTHKGLERYPGAARTMATPRGLYGDALKQYFEEQANDLNDLTRNPYTAPDNNEWAAAWHRVRRMTPDRENRGATCQVIFNESPNEARQRLMNKAKEDLTENDAQALRSGVPSRPASASRTAVQSIGRSTSGWRGLRHRRVTLRSQARKQLDGRAISPPPVERVGTQ